MVHITKSIRGVVSLLLLVVSISFGISTVATAASPIPADGTYECSTGVKDGGSPSYTILAGAVTDGTSCTGDVVIAPGVSTIYSRAFEVLEPGNPVITGITIPNSVTSIGEYAFVRQTALTSLSIPNSVTSIGADAFFGTSSLTSISVGSENANYSSLGGVLFNKLQTQLIQYPIGKTASSYTIPSSVNIISNFAFAGETSLTSLTIPDSVTSIGDWAFSQLTSLTTLTIPDTVTSIGVGTFSYLSSLISLSIPNLLTSIPEDAFRNTTSLTTLTIPNSVTSIGNNAFFGATSLRTLSIPNSVNSIGVDAFRGATSLRTLTIPNSVTSIGVGTFSDLSSLTSLSIPNSVTSIGIVAFASATSLTSLTIPNSVTSIGTSAFTNTPSLTQYTYCGTTLTQTQLNTAGLNGKTRISDCSSTHSPLFTSASSYDGRVTVQIANYDSAFTYAVTSSAGQASVNSTGLVTVTGLGIDQSVTVTVTVTRSGYASLTGSITGRSQVAPMLPGTKPTVTLSDTLITCTIGSYSATPTSSAFSLFVDGKHVSTNFSALGEYLPDWIIPWATSSTITRTAALTTASWSMSDAYKGKEITCATLAYSKNAIGLTASQVLVAR